MLRQLFRKSLIRKYWSLGLIGIIFLVAQLYKAAFMAPSPDYVWDNVYMWDWARSFSYGDFSSFVNDSHHLMRWGSWGLAAVLIDLFSDSVLNYYLATFIPSVLAGLLFVYFTWRYVGVWQSLIFALLWFFDGELFRATFQLLPTGQSLLPIAILLLLCTRATDTGKVSTTLAVLISVCVFWLYGVKETYLAFLPAITWLLWRTGGLRPVMILGCVMVGGYFLETLMFHWISDGFSVFGRIHAIVFGDQHVKIMLESTHYVAQQTQYFDSGITMRWAKATGMASIAFYPAFLFCVMLMANRTSNASAINYQPQHVVALFLLSFIVFSSFFVLSVSPIRLGHGLVSRYLAIGLPFAYIVILMFVSAQLANSRSAYKFAVLAMLPFFVAPAINRFADYRELSIVEVSRRYDQFGADFNNYDCLSARQRSIAHNQLDLIPNKLRSERTQRLIRNKHAIKINDWFLVREGDQQCKNIYTVSRGETMRF